MIEGVGLAALWDLSGWIVLVTGVATHVIIPRWTHNERIKDLKEQLAASQAEAKEWRAAAVTSMGTNSAMLTVMQDIRDAGRESR
jgi:hypothetical protein